MGAKKIVPAGKFNPFWSEDNFGAFIDTAKDYNVRDNYPYLVYNNAQYLPFYSLGSDLSRVGELVRDITSTEVVEGVVMPKVIAQGNTTVRAKLASLLPEKKYSQLLFAIDRAMYNLSSKHLKNAANKLWETGFRQPDTKLYLPTSVSQSGALNIIKSMKHGSRWGIGSATTKAGGQSTTKKYLFSKYFVSYMPHIIADLKENTFGINYTNVFQKEYGYVPLASLMFKAEHYSIMRASFMANAEVDASLLELWVDKSLMEDTIHPIKQQFTRGIAAPLNKSGVEVKVFDNLSVQMFEGKGVPKFKSIDGEEKWIEERMENFLERERATRGIIIERKSFDKALSAFLGAVG